MILKFNYLLSLLIIISFICFPQQKKFLFDNLHAETAGNADWVIDEDSNVPGRYPTPAQSTVTSTTAESYWTGALSSWGIDLVKLGHSVETLTSGSITYGTANAQDLKNYDVFVIDEPNTLFTSSEKIALINFVQNGGGLFMISDHTGSDRNNDGYDSPVIWNDLFTNNTLVTNPFGMAVDLTNISQTSTNVLSGDYLTAGTYGNVTAMKWNNGATATLNTTANSSVTGVVWTTGTAHGNTGLMVARAKYGLGRVVLVCDSSPADDGTGGSGNTLYVGWLDPLVNGSHANLHMNGSLWLAKILEPAASATLVAAPTSLTGFSYTAGSGPSASQSYNLSGTNLTGAPGNITVTGPADYQVSNNNSTWGSSTTIAYSSATLSSTPVYIRLKSGLTAGNYNLENVSNAGGGATTINVPCSGTVNPIPALTLTTLIEGFYNNGTMTPDTVKVTLRDASLVSVGSSSAVINSSGIGVFSFPNAVNGIPYWLDITHRNAVETYSSTTQSFTAGLLSYNLTTSQSQALGNNLVLKGTKWCIYSGDINQDGIVDSGDMGIVDNDNAAYVVGYTKTDVNGDGIVDSGDLGLADNNNAKYIGKITPPGAPFSAGTFSSKKMVNLK
jgi:hypothetical protein